MHDIHYTGRARRDLESISSYLQDRSSAAAHAVITAIEESIEQLAKFPLMAPVTDEPAVRELTIVRYPYKVYYRIGRDRIVVAHIRDARRTPWRG